ncbi:MAG: translation initiation factor IF-2 N-terminal domain-containing protein [Syntrophomonadaceae bacterium]|nr:translation initiation factor IF-2 N-terminal domain-containing protein [Syntrophomonadaceae bacterium]
MIIAAWFKVRKQKLLIDQNSRELKNTLIEASAVREDLAGLLENSVEISQIIVDNLDERIEAINNLDSFIREADEKQQQLEQTINSIDSLIPAIQPEIKAVNEDKYDKSLPEPEDFCEIAIEQSEIKLIPQRCKVYELAREQDMSSKSLIALLNNLGYKISHHMSLLDETVVERVKEEILLGSLGATMRTDSAVQHLSLVSRVELHREDRKVNLSINDKPGSDVTIDFTIDDLKSAHPYLAVRTLYEKGFSVLDIAKMLDRGQGEVNLILNLTRKKQACV